MIIKYKYTYRALVFFVIQSFSLAASAICGLSLTANNLTIDWSMTWTIQSVSITVSKTNPAACTFGLGFTKGGAPSYTRYLTDAGAQLNYQLYQDSGGTHILKDAPDTVTVNDVVMVTLPAGSGPQIVQYYFDIPFVLATTPLMAAAGAYTDSFTINAYEGVDPSLFAAPADATVPVAVVVNIEKLINLSFIDIGGVFQENTTTKDINFGQLRTGAVSRFNMAIRTNAGFSVTVSSANAGQLKHITKNSYVPYTFYINNVLADLTGVVPVVSGSGQTSMSGLGYPVSIVMGTTGVGALAGSYRDVLTVTAIVTD